MIATPQTFSPQIPVNQVSANQAPANQILPDNTDSRSLLRQQIKLSFQKATAQKKRLLRTDRRLSIATLVLSALATFIAGESAIANEPIMGNWRFTTTVASLCTLGATVTTGIQKQVAPTDLLIESSECAAKLKALSIETIPAMYEVSDVSETYQRLLAEFASVET
ncbi:MAG: hypothetical protein AAF703_08655 [Cyanobacteria bacterium P01_D01_bin.105]